MGTPKPPPQSPRVELFPVLFETTSKRLRMVALGCPEFVPWRLLVPHQEQAMRNHGQTLRRLAERGGLGPDEMVAILENRKWRGMSDESAIARLLEILQERSP